MSKVKAAKVIGLINKIRLFPVDVNILKRYFLVSLVLKYVHCTVNSVQWIRAGLLEQVAMTLYT